MPDGRLARFAITLVVLAAMVLPAMRDVDSFPLSSHPMYASARDDIAELTSAVAVDVEGSAVRLSLDLIARTDDPLIAQTFLRTAVASGRTQEVCGQIADRVARSDRSTTLRRVEIRTEELDLVAFVTGDAGTIDSVVHATCEIER